MALANGMILARYPVEVRAQYSHTYTKFLGQGYDAECSQISGRNSNEVLGFQGY